MGKYIWYEHIVCMDGFTLSVQAGEGLYCEPKESPYDKEGRWKKDFGYKSVEIMLQWGHKNEPLFDEYIFSHDDPLEYVPVELLAKVIKKHGGVIQGGIPPFHKGWKQEFYQNLKKE